MGFRTWEILPGYNLTRKCQVNMLDWEILYYTFTLVHIEHVTIFWSKIRFSSDCIVSLLQIKFYFGQPSSFQLQKAASILPVSNLNT